MGLWTASKDGLKQWRNYIHVELGFRADPRFLKEEAS
jgi:hypothetical protein